MHTYQVPRQPPNSNCCGFYMVSFLKYFLKVKLKSLCLHFPHDLYTN